MLSLEPSFGLTHRLNPTGIALDVAARLGGLPVSAAHPWGMLQGCWVQCYLVLYTPLL